MSSISWWKQVFFFLSLVDDYSRKLWVYTLKSKDETFDKFKELRIMVENQMMRKLKKFRTNNGLEFCSEWFDGNCKNEGIRRHKTVRDTPQQNGLAERMNKTIIERMRCMLSKASLPRSFWVEIVMSKAFDQQVSFNCNWLENFLSMVWETYKLLKFEGVQVYDLCSCKTTLVATQGTKVYIYQLSRGN